MPPGIGCDSTLTVGNPGGLVDTALFNGTPTITNIPFASGPAAGGSNLIIVGQNLIDCTVTLGGAVLSPLAQSMTSIVAVTPGGAPGPTPIVITSPTGCQTTGTFTYQ